MRQNLRNSRWMIMTLMGLLAMSVLLIWTEPVFAGEDGSVRWEQNGVVLTGTTDGSAVTITGCSSEQKYYDVTIPEEIDGLPVTAMDSGTFRDNCSVTSIQLPKGMTHLPNGAFYGCSALTKIDLNQVLDIPEWTTFWMNASLESVTVAEDNPGLEVVDGVLFNQDMTDLILYPVLRPGKTYTIPDGVSNLWSHAFWMTQELEEVTLSDDIEGCSDSFFNCPRLRVLNLNMIANAYGDSFRHCSALEKVTVSPDNEMFDVVDGILFSKDRKALKFYPPAHSGDCYQVPNGVTVIGESAFQSSKLKQILLPGSLKEIMSFAFAYSEELKELIFPEGLTTIGTNACTGCESLAAIYVPDSVNGIFYGSLDGPMMGPYAHLYGNTRDADGEFTTVYKYASEHSDEYTFHDIKEEKIPWSVSVICPDELGMDVDAPPYDLKAVSFAPLTYESDAPKVVSVDAFGILTPHANGTAEVTVTAAEDEYHAPMVKTIHVTVGTGIYIEQKDQTITGKSKISKYYGCEAFVLGQKAKTPMTYRSSNKEIATVSKAGKVMILRPGKVKIYVTAAETDYYHQATRTVTIVARVKAPSLKAGKSGRKVKLSWAKVPKAKGYQLYVKFPGKQKFEKVLTESAKVKSVTHRGLAKGKKYQYKLRAWTKVGGKKYYSAFSKVKTVKIK